MAKLHQQAIERSGRGMRRRYASALRPLRRRRNVVAQGSPHEIRPRPRLDQAQAPSRF